MLPLNLGTTLGGIGKALDPTVKPVTDTVVSLTQKVGATTGLGQPWTACCNRPADWSAIWAPR